MDPLVPIIANLHLGAAGDSASKALNNGPEELKLATAPRLAEESDIICATGPRTVENFAEITPHPNSGAADVLPKPKSWADLPQEVVVRVCHNLPVADLALLQRVSKKLQETVLAQELPLKRKQALHRAICESAAVPPTLACDRASRIFCDHFHNARGQILNDALAWLKDLSQEHEHLAEKHAAFRTGVLGPSLASALQEVMPSYAELNTVEKSVLDMLLPLLQLRTKTQMVAVDLMPLFVDSAVTWPTKIFASVTFLRIFGLATIVSEKERSEWSTARMQRCSAAMQERLTNGFAATLVGVPTDGLVDFLSRQLNWEQRIAYHRLLTAPWLTKQGAMFYPIKPELQLRYVRITAFFYSKDMTAEELDALHYEMERPEGNKFREVRKKVMDDAATGVFRRLGQDEGKIINQFAAHHAPHAMLAHALEIATRADESEGPASTQNAEIRRRQLRMQLPREPALALSYIRERWPESPQQIVDVVAEELGDGFEWLNVSLRHNPSDEVCYLNLIKAFVEIWPDIEPTAV